MNPGPASVAFRATNQPRRRTSAGIAVRERDGALDPEPRTVTLAPDVVDALAGAGDAGWSFADLSTDTQRRLVRAIERAATAVTRRRRIAKLVETLRAGLV